MRNHIGLMGGAECSHSPGGFADGAATVQQGHRPPVILLALQANGNQGSNSNSVTFGRVALACSITPRPFLSHIKDQGTHK